MALSRSEIEAMLRKEKNNNRWITFEIKANRSDNGITTEERNIEIINWFGGLNIERYTYDLGDLDWGFVHVLEEDIAVLFKTTWC